MNDVSTVRASQSIAPYTDPSFTGSVTSSANSNLLPGPTADVNPDDALAGFLVLEAMSRGVGLDTAIKNVNELRKQKHAEWEKQKAALMEAMKNKEESSFWGDLGKICGTIGQIAAVVASVAVVVGTAGAGAPFVLAVAGACLSGAALAQGQFQVLQKLGVSDEVSGYIEIGLTVASAACSFGASALKGAEAVGTLEKTMDTAAKFVGVGSAVAAGAQGAAIIAKSQADGAAEDCYADAANARLHESHFQWLLLAVLDDLDESEKEHRRTVSRVTDAIETRDMTLTIASGNGMTMSNLTIESTSTSTYALQDPSGAPTGATIDRPIAGGEGSLPAPLDLPIGGDLVAQLAVLFVKELREDRKRADHSSDREEQSRMREGEMRVAELHAKADEIRREGLARGLSQIAGAACNVGGGIISLNSSKKAGEAALQIGSGGGKAFDSVGTIAGNGYQADAVDRQAQADRHESIGEGRKVARDKFGEQATDAKQLIQRVIELTKEINESRNATLLAAASMKA